MQIEKFSIDGLMVLTPKAFADERGYFSETFNQKVFEQSVGKNFSFYQDNFSSSLSGVLRGLHYQIDPNAQGKLIRCTRGSIFDVAVDLRKKSSTFGRWISVELSAENRKIFWIPPGFAHGFLALENGADVQYKASGYYSPSEERTIRWDDSSLAINWPDQKFLIISEKDRAGISFGQADYF